MINALVFDFDGLLVDTETVLIDAWQYVHEQDGVAFDRRHMHDIVGHVDKEFDPWQFYASHHDRGELDRRYREHARRLTLAAPVLPGALQLIQTARAAGWALAVASNSGHAHVEGHLGYRGMLGLFDHIACREDVQKGKPEPDIYLSALRALKAKPQEAVAFEDSQPGHVAAFRAGLNVVVVPNPSTAHGSFVHAHWRVQALSEVTLTELSRRFGGTS